MDVLTFPRLVEGTFVKRLNRFLTCVKTDEKRVSVHVHDPGRLSELLVPGARVLLLPRKGRKTDYHMIAVWREGYGWVFIHSGYHRRIVERLIESRTFPEFIQVLNYIPEVWVNQHRLDFGLIFPDRLILMETKGCTLFEGDACTFPDAPTERGKEHLRVLERRVPSILIFLAFSPGTRYVTANHRRDYTFASESLIALDKGVHVWGIRFGFDGKTLRSHGRIPFIFPPKRDILLLYEALREISDRYNSERSPEARAITTALWKSTGTYFNVLFWGYLHSTCDPYDYFDDFRLMAEDVGIHSKVLRYIGLGDTYLVTFQVKT